MGNGNAAAVVAMTAKNEWGQLIDGFAGKRALLIGDTILDRYTYGTALGLSAETPTIVASKQEVRHSLGGAALVCRNLLELGAAVTFVTLVGEDEEAATISQFSASKLELLTVSEAGRKTTVKHRFWVDGYKLFQLDTRDDSPIAVVTADHFMNHIADRMNAVDAIIISDYRHGLLTPELIGRLSGTLRGSGKPVFIDSQIAQNAGNHRQYRGQGLMCLNLKEARSIDPRFEPRREPSAFTGLRRELNVDRIVVKLGADGSMMFDGDRVVMSPASPIEVVDTSGAGDAFLAALSLCADADPEIALRIANTWAGLSVAVRGTDPPRQADLRSLLAGGEDRTAAGDV